MYWLLLGLIFLAVIFGFMGLWLLIGGATAEKKRMQSRLRGVQQVRDWELGDALAEKEQKQAKKRKKRKEQAKKKAFSDIPTLERKLSKVPWAQKLSFQLRQAQLPLTVTTFVLISGAASALGVAGSVVLTGGLDPLMSPAGLLLGALPYLYVIIAVKRRLKMFAQQLPDALDMLSSCVKGGLALNSAIQNVADEMPDPAGDEFKIVADEMTFGMSTQRVLRRLANRLDISDVRFFCAALMIQKETGGNLAEVLDGLQTTIRERFRILGQLKTLTAQGRMSGYVVGGLPIGLSVMIYLANPDYMNQLFTTSMGHKLIAAALIFQGIGVLMIRKIVDIKV
jgi:tight adherence protein B